MEKLTHHASPALLMPINYTHKQAIRRGVSMIIMRAYVAHYVYDSHSISPSLFECCTSHFVIESRRLFDWRSMPNIFNLFAFACIIVTPDAFKYLNQPFQVLSTLIISQELCFIIHAIHSNFFLHKFKSVNSFKGEFIFFIINIFIWMNSEACRNSNQDNLHINS